MDITDPEHSHVICVNQCPERRLNSREDLFHFSEQTGSLLCRYDLKPSHYFYVNNSKLGPCPTLPVYERFVFLFHNSNHFDALNPKRDYVGE